MDYFSFATENALREFSAHQRSVVDTHWIEEGQAQPGGLGLHQALCGAHVHLGTFSTQPSCLACQEAMLAIERWAC